MGGSARGRTGDQTSLERVYKYKGVEVEKDRKIKQSSKQGESTARWSKAQQRVESGRSWARRTAAAPQVGSGRAGRL